jgi:hypothetical protein
LGLCSQIRHWKGLDDPADPEQRDAIGRAYDGTKALLDQ